MIPQQANPLAREKFTKLSKELSEKEKTKSRVCPKPSLSFPKSVLSQQFWNGSFNHGHTQQLNILFRMGNVTSIQTNTITHTPQTPKITDTCMGCRETGN